MAAPTAIKPQPGPQERFLASPADIAIYGGAAGGGNPDTGRDEWVKRTEVQLIVGYRGLIDLARRSGHITSLSANIHYADDEMWLYEEGTEAVLRHRPGPQEGEKLHAYAIAKFKDGGHAYVVLPWAKVMLIRDNSQGWKAASRTAAQHGKSIKSPWASHEDEMAKKTAIRALAKYLPLSIEMMEAVQIDGARADFAAFAAQPAEGLAIEQCDGGEETDAPVPEDQPAQIEKAAEVTAAPARPKEPDTAREGKQAAARRHAGGAKPQEVLPLDASAAEAPSIDVLIASVRDGMAVDVADGATAAQVLAAWSASLDQILKADQETLF